MIPEKEAHMHPAWPAWERYLEKQNYEFEDWEDEEMSFVVFVAGWNAAFSHLKNILSEERIYQELHTNFLLLESEDFNGEKNTN